MVWVVDWLGVTGLVSGVVIGAAGVIDGRRSARQTQAMLDRLLELLRRQHEPGPKPLPTWRPSPSAGRFSNPLILGRRDPVDDLPPLERLVFTLAYYERIPLSDIAAIIGMQEGQAQGVIDRATAKLGDDFFAEG
jgi:DNA-directed RNA polymerase specialized sigma24 family protein